MTPEQQKVIDELRKAGYAVSIFTPEEVENLFRTDLIEDAMVAAGWEAIEQLKYDEIEEED